MKLYECPRNSIVRLLEDSTGPIGVAPFSKGDVIDFFHVDGAYSLCRINGEFTHLAAWTEVEVVRPMDASGEIH